MEFIIKYWIEVVFGLLISVIVYLYQAMKRSFKMGLIIKQSIQSLLKIKILELYKQYSIKEYLTVTESEKINTLYQCYRKFECCDVIEDVMNQLNTKQIRKED